MVMKDVVAGVEGEGVKISQNLGPLVSRGQNIEFSCKSST